MIFGRGEIVLAWYPFASGVGMKRRPCIVIQNDEDNKKILNTVVAQITSNLNRIGDKSHVLIDINSSEGKNTGLLRNSLVSCINIVTIEKKMIQKAIGTSGPGILQEIDNALKAALQVS